MCLANKVYEYSLCARFRLLEFSPYEGCKEIKKYEILGGDDNVV